MEAQTRTTMVEPIICPFWVSNDDRFIARRYRAWDRPCRLCGRKLVVSEAIKQRLESNHETVLVCEQCALVRSEDIESLLPTEQKSGFDPECPICTSLKKQEEAVGLKLKLAQDSPEADAIQRKWKHLSNARWAHRFKAHNQVKRGNEQQ